MATASRTSLPGTYVSVGSLPMTDEVRYERVGAAAVLTIDREHRRNAVDAATAERLRKGLDAFEADDDARVLVLTGAGEVAFCAGADLKAIETFGQRLDDPAGPWASPAWRRPSRRSPRSAAGAWPAAWS
jgi:enoyl-CoA hydratase/carnithine racemase